MKTFRGYISEEITINALGNGGIDIDRDAVRDEINGILSNITMASCITPYTALTKVRKALSYFSIFLPKRVYMEGKHGVEVWQISQFGDKMGMTDQGEFIKSVPGKHYLFFHYHLMGSMYMVHAKIVDEAELNKEMDRAEAMIAEGAAMQQALAKTVAPKEDAHTALGDCDCSQGDSPSTKQAVDVMMRRKDKKLSAAELDEGRMPASVIKHKQRIANMTPEEKAKKFAGKSQEELKSMARRHGYGKDSNEYAKHGEKKLDEVSLGKLVSYKNKAGEGREKGVALADKKMKGKAKVNASAPKHPYMEETQIDEIKQSKEKRYDSIIKAFKTAPGQVGGQSTRERDAAIQKHMGGTVHKGEIRRAIKRHFHTKGLYEDGQIDEKLTKRMKASDVISDFVHSQDPKFQGKSKKERMKMALGAYYGMHPEKSRK